MLACFRPGRGPVACRQSPKRSKDVEVEKRGPAASFRTGRLTSCLQVVSTFHRAMERDGSYDWYAHDREIPPVRSWPSIVRADKPHRARSKTCFHLPSICVPHHALFHYDRWPMDPRERAALQGRVVGSPNARTTAMHGLRPDGSRYDIRMKRGRLRRLEIDGKSGYHRRLSVSQSNGGGGIVRSTIFLHRRPRSSGGVRPPRRGVHIP